MRELENMHITSDQSYRQLCEMAGVSVQSYMRWKERAQRGAEVVAAPGPKKVEPLDVAGLNEAIGQLAHGRKRTHGTGVLFQQYHDRISRRAFLSLVEETRQEFLHDRLAEQMRLEWRCPGLVWASVVEFAEDGEDGGDAVLEAADLDVEGGDVAGGDVGGDAADAFLAQGIVLEIGADAGEAGVLVVWVDAAEEHEGLARAEASPVVRVTHPEAELTHEAAIGRIADDKIEGLMAKGLDEEQAIDAIVAGLLR